MARKNVKLNYVYNVSYQILLLFTPLITTPYVSRVLSANGIGTYSYTDSVVSYFTMFAALGTMIYGQREISYHQDNRSQRSKAFWEIECLSLLTTVASLTVYFFFIQGQKNYLIFLVEAINILAAALDITWLLQGMEEFGKIVFRNIFIKILSILFIFIFVKTKSDLALYVFGICFFTFFSNATLWLYIPRFVNKPDWKNLNIFCHLRGTLSLFIPTVAIQIYTVLDKTMLGAFASNYNENGYYEQAMKISKLSLVLVTSLGTVLVPRIGYLFKQKQIKALKEYLYNAYNFVWFLGVPICFGLIGISQNFVPWFFGSGYQKVSSLLCILSFLILAIGINNVTGVQYLIPTKRQHLFTYTVIFGAVLNFITNLLLIPRYASVGTSIASVFAETCITFSQLFIMRKEISMSRVFKTSIRYFIAGSVMLALLLCENLKLNSSIFHTVLMIVSGMLTYVLMLIILKDRFFLQNMRLIFEKVRSRF